MKPSATTVHLPSASASASSSPVLSSAPASISPRQKLSSTATSATTSHPTAVSATTVSGRGEEGNPVTTANMSSKRQHNGLHPNSSFHDLSSANTYDVPEMTDMQPRPPRGLLRGSSVSGPILETVQEGIDSSSLPDDMGEANIANDSESKPSTIAASSCASRADKESGSDSGGNASHHRPEGRKSSKQRTPSTIRKPGDIISKRSFASLPLAKGKSGEATPRNMIVEAETVSSVPQISLGVGQGDRDRNLPNRADVGGVLRTKASDETIRPKKKDKKPAKSSRAVPAATGKWTFHNLNKIPSPLRCNFRSLMLNTPKIIQAPRNQTSSNIRSRLQWTKQTPQIPPKPSSTTPILLIPQYHFHRNQI